MPRASPPVPRPGLCLHALLERADLREPGRRPQPPPRGPHPRRSTASPTPPATGPAPDPADGATRRPPRPPRRPPPPGQRRRRRCSRPPRRPRAPAAPRGVAVRAPARRGRPGHACRRLRRPRRAPRSALRRRPPHPPAPTPPKASSPARPTSSCERRRALLAPRLEVEPARRRRRRPTRRTPSPTPCGRTTTSSSTTSTSSALDAFLRTRLPDYDYDRHVGGVAYAFLRGADRDDFGLYADRPPRALIDALAASLRRPLTPMRPTPPAADAVLRALAAADAVPPLGLALRPLARRARPGPRGAPRPHRRPPRPRPAAGHGPPRARTPGPATRSRRDDAEAALPPLPDRRRLARPPRGLPARRRPPATRLRSCSTTARSTSTASGAPSTASPSASPERLRTPDPLAPPAALRDAFRRLFPGRSGDAPDAQAARRRRRAPPPARGRFRAGPGTGKTTTVARLLALALRRPPRPPRRPRRPHGQGRAAPPGLDRRPARCASASTPRRRASPRPQTLHRLLRASARRPLRPLRRGPAPGRPRGRGRGLDGRPPAASTPSSTRSRTPPASSSSATPTSSTA